MHTASSAAKKTTAKGSQKAKPKREAPNDVLKTVGHLKGHKSAVFKVAVTPSSLFTCSLDNTVREWDVEGQTEKRSLTGHKRPVRSLIASESFLVSGSEDKTIKVWDVRQGSCSLTIPSQSPALSMVFGKDGKEFFTGHEDGSIKKWEVGKDQPLATVKKQSGSIFALFNAGDHLVSGSRDRTIWKLKPDDLSPMNELVFHLDAVTCFTSLKGNLLSGSRDQNIKQFKFNEEGKDEGWHIHAAHTDWVNALVPSPDESMFVSASKDTTIKLWDAETRQLKAHVLKHNAIVHDLAWFKGTILVSTSHDGECLLQNLKLD